MNKFSIFTLKALRKIYAKVFSVKPLPMPICEHGPDKAAQIIYDVLMKDKPCMIGRFGSNELNCLLNYRAVKGSNRNIYSYVKGDTFDWWWNKGIVQNMHLVAGFFPPTVEYLSRFGELMLQDIPEIDVLGSWLPHESEFEKELANAKKVFFPYLEPYWAIKTWTKALEHKKVLVVHPFSQLIEKQYQKRNLLFKNNLLPEFELKTIKAVLSLADEKTEFANWFVALEHMQNEIDKVDYDICIIGAGAYGFHLAAHVKRKCKKAIHLGGALQIMFGIRGNRWEVPNYGVKEWGIPYNYYNNLVNEHWVRPGENEKPKNANVVEGACYW